MQSFFPAHITARSARSGRRFGRRALYLSIAIALLFLLQMPASSLPLQTAQVSPRPAQRRHIHHLLHARTHRSSAAASGTQATPQPAEQSPRVLLSHGLLTVTANNSGLGQILSRIAGVSGMTVEGFSTGSRVYGVYGPGRPNEVLTSLLTGSGYNFMMLGRAADGVPRKLVLTRKTAAPPPSATERPVAHPQPEPSMDEEEPPGPGAIVHVPPTQQDKDTRVQQNLQRLEQMHQLQTKQHPH